MNKDDTVYLHHVLECIRRITEDIAEGRERFMEAHTLQDAVLRNLQVMAESTQRLSDTAKATQPDVEWRKIAGRVSYLLIKEKVVIVEPEGGTDDGRGSRKMSTLSE